MSSNLIARSKLRDIEEDANVRGSRAPVCDLAELARLQETWRREGKLIVLTTGVFDVVHRGHLSTLESAASLGDRMIVGINADASVQRKKGPKRPINPAADRAELLAALRFVDAVIVFDEPSEQPIELVRAVRPDVFVKSKGEWTDGVSDLKSAVDDLGGQWVLMDHVEGNSTSELIKRILTRYAP